MVLNEESQLVSCYWDVIRMLVPECAPSIVDIALRLAAIPATSASAERVWSAFGHIVSKKRNRLGNDKIAKLGFLYFNTRTMKRTVAHRGIVGFENLHAIEADQHQQARIDHSDVDEDEAISQSSSEYTSDESNEIYSFE